MRHLVRLATWPGYRSFEAAARDPEAARKRTWDAVRTLIATSPFWRERGLAGRLEEMPPTVYDDYRATLERDFASPSGRSSLNGEEILFWAKSSGTSATPKLFPITPSYRAQFQLTNPPFLHSLSRRFPGFLNHPVLYFAATLPSDKSVAGAEVGAISSFNYRRVPALLRRFYAFPLEVFRDTETFFRWGPLYALATDLSAMISITPAMILRFTESLEANAASYEAIIDGRAQPPAPLPPVRISRERREILKRALAQRPVSFRELWPSLAFVTCWKASTCGMQLPLLAPHLRDVPVVDATYSASEGWMTVPLENERIGGPLHAGSHIVEFLPLGEEPSAKNLLPAWAIAEGREYEVFLTTAMGFVRYRLHDIVRCNGFFHRSPVLEFRQKAGALVSIGHTRVSEADLMDALSHAGFRASGRFFFAPATEGNRLTCFTDSAFEDAHRILAAVDARIGVLNPEYADDLRTGLLLPMNSRVLASIDPAWMEAVHAQAKPSVLRQRPPEQASAA